MYSRDESNTDGADALRRRQLLPVSNIAIQDQTAREKSSQTLIDEAIQKEQELIRINPILQEVPGEPINLEDRIEEAVISIPEKMMNPFKVVPHRTTISGVMKERMGVANIRAKTRKGAVPSVKRGIAFHQNKSAFGTEIKEKSFKDTPVKRLNLIDQFFNMINAIFS